MARGRHRRDDSGETYERGGVPGAFRSAIIQSASRGLVVVSHSARIGRRRETLTPRRPRRTHIHVYYTRAEYAVFIIPRRAYIYMYNLPMIL